MTTDTASHRGRLTTHVLDTAHGRPGMGIAVALTVVTGIDYLIKAWRSSRA